MTTWRTEIRATTRLALPIAAVQLGQMGLGLADVLFVGHYSETALAGIALGHMGIWSLMVFGMGVLTALDPLVSQAIGARDEDRARLAIQRGLVLAAVLSIPLSLLGMLAEPGLRLLGQPEEVIPEAAQYVLWSLPGVLPFLVYVALRQSLQALSRVRPVVLTTITANILNIGLDWGLVFGEFGLPEMGLRGAALASVLCRIWMCIALVWIAWPLLRGQLRPFDRRALRIGEMFAVIRIGLPIGLQFVLEMGAFAATAVFMGWIGATEVAGHKIALILASLSFMVPAGISAAAAVRVGYAVGRGDPTGLRRAAGVSMIGGAGVMIMSGIVFLAMPEPLARLFTSAPDVIAVAVVLLPIAGFFQVFDGLQVVCIGILRGLSETRTALVVNLIGFWIIGVPTGILLAFGDGVGPAALHAGFGLGPTGLWWGLTVGLALVAVILAARVLMRVRTVAAIETGPNAAPP